MIRAAGSQPPQLHQCTHWLQSWSVFVGWSVHRQVPERPSKLCSSIRAPRSLAYAGKGANRRAPFHSSIAGQLQKELR